MHPKSFIRQLRLLMISILSMVLMGCFGDGDGPQKIPGLQREPVPVPPVGVLVNTEVTGATWESSGGESGLTEDGEFPYFDGYTVEFFVGDILLGIPGVTVDAAPMITPYELAGCVGPLELCQAAVNIFVFLQTINENSPDTADGIIISDATQEALAGESLNFNTDEATFTQAFQDLIDDAPLPGTTIITEEEALGNFCRNTYLPNGGEDTFGYPLEGCEVGPDEELLTNGDFELPDADAGDIGCSGLLGPGWECFNTPFINSNNFDSGQQGPLAHSPDQTVKMFGPFIQDAGTGIFQDVPVLGRQTYTATAWAQNWTGGVDSALNNIGIMQLEFLDDTGEPVPDGTFEIIVDASDDNVNTYLPPNTWVELSITAEAPAGTFSARVQLLHIQINCSDPDPFCPPEAGGSVFWDDASLVGPAGLPPPPPPPPFEIPEGFELTFSDEFNEDVYGPGPVTVDPDKWFIETGYGPPRTDPGWGNDEWQEYTMSTDNVRVEDGNLVIDALCVPQVDGAAPLVAGGVTLQAAGDNLLANGTFETPDATGGDVANPPGWDVTFQSFTNANDGPNSGPVSHDDGGNQSVKMFGDGGRIEQTVPVTAGLSTTLTAYAMNWTGDSLDDNGQALLALTFFSDLAGTAEISTTELFFQAPAQLPVQDGAEVGDWAQMSITEVAPAGAMSARARLQIVPDPAGALFWDDASLTQIADEPPAGDNLLVNTTFETPDATGADQPNPPGWDVTFQSFTVANDGPDSGPVSHDDGGTQSAKMFGDGGRLEQTVPVTAGLSTTLTAYAMNWTGDSLDDNGQALLALTFFSDLAGTAEISTTELFFQAPAQLPVQDGAEVGDWAQMSITEVAPAGAMSARARLQIVPDPAGALFWDDVSLTQGTVEPPEGCDAGIRNDPTKPDKITSGRINTQDLFEFQYGIVRARINTPGGLAVWPALWMLGFDFPVTPWPNAGEIDIMEQFQNSSSPLFTHSTLHFCDDSVVPAGQECDFANGYESTNTTPIGNSLLFDGPAGQDWSSDFHIYQLEWTEDRIIAKVDDVVFFNATINPDTMEEFRKPFYLILNVAMGGNLGPGGALPPSGNETYPQTYLVDWIRVYQEVVP